MHFHMNIVFLDIVIVCMYRVYSDIFASNAIYHWFGFCPLLRAAIKLAERKVAVVSLFSKLRIC